MKKLPLILTVPAILALFACSFWASAADSPRPTSPPSPTTTNPSATKPAPHSTYRASDLRNMPVKNLANEDLGKVEDLVLDLSNGSLRYAVVSFGGFLGVGDKYFAVPWKALKLRGDADGKHWHMVLNIDKERLKNAPGFDKSNWPDFAEATWAKSDEFYSNSNVSEPVPARK